MTYRVEPVEERSVVRMLKTIHVINAVRKTFQQNSDKSMKKTDSIPSAQLPAYCTEATRLKVGARGFFPLVSVCVNVLVDQCKQFHLSIAEGLCMEQVQNVTAVSAYSVLRNANYCHELNFPSPVTQSWLKQSRLSTGLVNDTLAKTLLQLKSMIGLASWYMKLLQVKLRPTLWLSDE
ncbi:hypothetical protein T08_5247 [Trichinella sp. T8]|nr:hypothetical protein T08_5247 [Trichinella sp. T8]